MKSRRPVNSDVGPIGRGNTMDKQSSSWDPRVQEVIASVEDAIVETAASALIGLYVGGSLVAGDFDPSVSDIDFLAVLAIDPSDELAIALEGMHGRLDRQHPAWAGRIEVVYISAARLKTHHQGIPRMAVISPGEPFHILSGGSDWVLTWYPLREEAVTLVGPEICDVIPPIARTDFLTAVREHVQAVPGWIKEDATRGASAYAILTVCRGLYTLKSGTRASKREAAQWAVRQFPEWAPLLESALTWRSQQWSNPATDRFSVTAAREFVREVTAKII